VAAPRELLARTLALMQGLDPLGDSMFRNCNRDR
jgi:hypothetical protein